MTLCKSCFARAVIVTGVDEILKGVYDIMVCIKYSQKQFQVTP